MLATLAAYLVSIILCTYTSWVYSKKTLPAMIEHLSNMQFGCPSDDVPDHILIGMGVSLVAFTELIIRGWWAAWLFLSLFHTIFPVETMVEHSQFFSHSIAYIMAPMLFVRVVGYCMHVTAHVRNNMFSAAKLRHTVMASVGTWAGIFGLLAWLFSE